MLAFLRKRLDDFLGIAERPQDRLFVVGDQPTVADRSMARYLFFRKMKLATI